MRNNETNMKVLRIAFNKSHDENDMEDVEIFEITVPNHITRKDIIEEYNILALNWSFMQNNKTEDVTDDLLTCYFLKRNDYENAKVVLDDGKLSIIPSRFLYFLKRKYNWNFERFYPQIDVDIDVY